MANDVEPLTSSQKYLENSAISPDQEVEAALPEQPSMTWSLQPGDSLNDVARLFYPRNKHMQQLFVAKSIQLSRETRLNPVVASSLFGSGDYDSRRQIAVSAK